MRTIALAALLAVAVGVFACRAPGLGSRLDRPAPRLARALCQAACDRHDRCADDEHDDRVCACETARDTGALRADWAAAFATCARDAPCDDAIDCEARATRAIGVGPLDPPPVVLRCLSKGDQCGGSFAQCKRLAALVDDARAAADGCATSSCDEWRACFAAFWRDEVAPAVPAWR